jgi:hypothetical protein
MVTLPVEASTGTGKSNSPAAPASKMIAQTAESKTARTLRLTEVESSEFMFLGSVVWVAPENPAARRAGLRHEWLRRISQLRNPLARSCKIAVSITIIHIE